MFRLSLLFAFFLGTFSASGRTTGVKTALVPEVTAISPGETFTIALKLEHTMGWHTYYKYPGVGRATDIKWTLPEGFTAGEIQWPAPEVLPFSGFTTYAYGGSQDALLTEITAPDPLPSSDPFTINANVKWLQCKTTCVMGKASLSTTIASGETTIDPANVQFFADARAAIPRTDSPRKITAATSGDTATLTLSEKIAEDATLHFVPDAPGQIKDTDFQELSSDGLVLTIPKPENTEFPERFTGILINDKGAPAVLINAPLSGETTTPAAVPAPAEPKTEPETKAANDGITAAEQAQIDEIREWGVTNIDGTEKNEETSIAFMVLFALVGGVILNIMPCVFPVLGIKIMGFVQQAGEDKNKVRLHGLVFAAGVILSLWVLVGLLLAAKATWGFQLQSPQFLAVLIGFLFLFGLSLSGVFEFGSSMTTVGGKLQSKQGYAGSFFSGLLTVAVATPCTGPFMGPALGFAISQPWYIAYLIFTALAIGVALPYVILSFVPALIKMLPRPGAWMETFKQFMAFPLYATCIWLVLVFGKSIGLAGLGWLLGGLLLTAMGAWAFGRYGTPVKKPRTRFLGRLAGAAAIGVFAFAALKGIATKPEHTTPGIVTKYGIEWEPFDLDRIIDLRAQGQTVFLDFTASW